MYGVPERELIWFIDYIFFTAKQMFFTGVPKVSILGPMLFMFIFNDMADVICYSKDIIFANVTFLVDAGKDVHIISFKLTNDWRILSA